MTAEPTTIFRTRRAACSKATDIGKRSLKVQIIPVIDCCAGLARKRVSVLRSSWGRGKRRKSAPVAQAGPDGSLLNFLPDPQEVFG